MALLPWLASRMVLVSRASTSRVIVGMRGNGSLTFEPRITHSSWFVIEALPGRQAWYNTGLDGASGWNRCTIVNQGRPCLDNLVLPPKGGLDPPYA